MPDLESVARELTVSLSEQNIDALLAIASNSTDSFDMVARFATSFRCLGNPENAEHALTLLVALDAFEDNADVPTDRRITNRLVGIVSDRQEKRAASYPGLDDTQFRRMEQRASVSLEVIQQLSKRKAVKLAGPLLASMQNESARKHIQYLLNEVLRNRFGSAKPRTLSSLAIIVTACLNNWVEEQLDYAIRITQKVFAEINGAAIYFACPLLAASSDPEKARVARRLLSQALSNRFGEADADTMKRIAGTITKVSSPESSAEDHAYARRILAKVLIETDNPLIYFVGLLVDAAKDPSRREVCLEHLGEIRNAILDGKKLGSAEDAILIYARDKLQEALSDPSLSACAEFFRDRMKQEGSWKEKQPKRREGNRGPSSGDGRPRAQTQPRPPRSDEPLVFRVNPRSRGLQIEEVRSPRKMRR